MCLRFWSRETGSAVPFRVSLLISILKLNLVLTYGIPPEFRGGVHMKPRHVIGSVPSSSGHAVAYRWRSLPRVRRRRASKPQGSSERVLPWQITMDQLIFASLSRTHYWYEVGMLKVPAVDTIYQVVNSTCVCFVCFLHSLWTSSSLDVPAEVTQEEGHTGFLIHLLSAVRALIFFARRIQSFLPLIDCEVEFCVLTI